MTLATPDGLCVTSTLNGACLKVNWDVVDTATGYKVYRSQISYGDFTRIATLASTTGLTYFDTPTTPNDILDNKWWYQVTATLGADESAKSGPTTCYNYAAFDERPIPHLSWTNLL